MNKLDVSKYPSFSTLPLDYFNTLNFSVYVLDFNWNYLFLNDFVYKNLGIKDRDLVGKNMWNEFRALSSDSAFIQLKNNSEKGINTNLITTSPLTSQRLNIVG